jgi:hypothetical protein
MQGHKQEKAETIVEILEAERKLSPHDVLWAVYRLGKTTASHEREAMTDPENYEAVMEWVNREMAAFEGVVEVAPTV